MVRSAVLTAAFLALVSSSQAQQLDWYALSQSNYAAIQSGLAELNAAATEMNKSLSATRDSITAAMDGVDLYVKQLMFGVWSQLPASMNFSMNDLSSLMNNVDKLGNYKSYVGYITDDYKQSVTDNVMIPAQSIVRDNLNAMTALYGNMWSNCAQQNAQKLLQPQLSVGRLKQCITLAIPYFSDVANTVNSMFQMGKSGGNIIANFINLCTSGSASCIQKFINDAPNLVNNLVASSINLQSIPQAVIQPGKMVVKECVALITADIQSALQNITSCL
uniref:Putative 30.5 kDa secreted protein n=1 Tax=Psorophora albipes TaxID=869069 RepID=T1DEP8_9DIPT